MKWLEENWLWLFILVLGIGLMFSGCECSVKIHIDNRTNSVTLNP
jgi:hypothetical protein